MVGRLVLFLVVIGALGAGLVWIAADSGSEVDAAPASTAARERAVQHYRARRYEEARAAFAEAIEAAPDDATLPALVARCYLEERGAATVGGRAPEDEDALVAHARSWAERALALDPDETVGLQVLYSVHAMPELRAFDPLRAREAAERLIELRPDNASFVFKYIEQMFDTIRFPAASGEHLPYQSDIGLEIALAHAERLHDRAPVGSVVRTQAAMAIARAHTCMGDFEAARREWARLAADVDDVRIRRRALIEAGFANLRLGRSDEAIATLRELVDLRQPNADWARWLIARALLDAGRPLDDVPERYQFGARAPDFDDATRAAWRFVDVAPAFGVDKRDGAGPSAFTDLDDDGWPDLVVAGCDTTTRLYRNLGGRDFEDVTVAAGLADLEAGFSTVAVDADGDADLDLFVARYGWSGPAANSLLRRGPDGRYRDVAAEVGLDDRGSGFGCGWADLDGDADLDLVVVNGVVREGSTSRVFAARGDGTFEDATERAGLREHPGDRTIGCALGDYDRDGDVDLFLNGFAPAPSRLYRNRGDGRFDEVAREAGVEHAPHAGYVAFFVDLDDDARPELLATCLADWNVVLDGYRGELVPEAVAETTKVFGNLGGGRFGAVGPERTGFAPAGTMGANLGDFDNDGRVDVYLGTGNPDVKRLEPNVMYRNDGGLRFTDVTSIAGVGHVGKGHGISVADVDADGDLDVYAPQGGFFHADVTPNALYRNDGGSRRPSLRVRLEGRVPNAFAVGAQVTLETTAGVQYREVACGTGFGSSNERELHFGLGDAHPTALRVRWPSGHEQRLENAPSSPWPREIVVREGEDAPRPLVRAAAVAARER